MLNEKEREAIKGFIIEKDEFQKWLDKVTISGRVDPYEVIKVVEKKYRELRPKLEQKTRQEVAKEMINEFEEILYYYQIEDKLTKLKQKFTEKD